MPGTVDMVISKWRHLPPRNAGNCISMKTGSNSNRQERAGLAMASATQPTVEGISIALLDRPPVNSLGHALRVQIASVIEAANDAPEIRVIVLVGAGQVFSGGADIREFGTPASTAEPTVRTLIGMIESSSKPVIAAIEGFALGGGLELALACHFRVATREAKIALPEVKLGLMPGAGGTQRLPRLIGAETALNMIMTGQTLGAVELEESGLFDALIDGDLIQGVVAFAAEVAAGKREAILARNRAVVLDNADAYFEYARRSLASSTRQSEAPLKCIDAVAAAVGKPYDDTLERKAFFELVTSPVSRALRHRFQAERACSKIADLPPGTATHAVEQVGVIGAGTMGAGIAMAMLDAGIQVLLMDQRRDALERGIEAIRGNYGRSLAKGKVSAEQVEQRLNLLRGVLDYQDLAGVDLVIEAVFEDMAVKESVFSTLDAVMKPGAILASNTSTLDLDQIAAFTKRPQDVVGLHFFSPANVMRLLEVVRGRQTGDAVLATVMQLAKRIGKIAVVSGVCDGFIGNRMFGHYTRVAGLLVEEGASPQQVDRALEAWGMSMGPFRMGDMAGLDIVLAVRSRHYKTHPEWKFPRSLDRLCELGRLGQKTGKGWYRYASGQRVALADPEVDALLDEYRREQGIAPRLMSDEEIVQRCIFALVNEASALLEEGIAQRASDVDVVALNGYAFPAHRGGPLFYAQEQGLYSVVRAMKQFGDQSGDTFWKPSPLLVGLAEAQSSFSSIGATP
ncbi:3-hydroxyacyl-CoA dehydrogenase NAD-binding domain-containing protein [Pseudoxanthomonas sp.]|uniref:3-hydroxyacyl-CoA dehydrogenase NAD-binding domain-containing protein n=1 Tax=Pseudoxanthomonas sp. TaxID=1871049 RepID=UPI0026202176|nr:3-hydroxyacyl-CoA dehydrogenase NAD-binding domain-containing protein [Pseudoxanthomonas sp.]WDS36944.1 MAG: 3-hydroxyacyl-CoA dehydrogenase NAD-binding domain-containing protein [Pseudoxanthomonas sp.]